MFTVGILTVSDKGSRGECLDKSGLAIKQSLDGSEAKVVQYKIVPDEKDIITFEAKLH